MQQAREDAKKKGLEGRKLAFIPTEGRTWNPALNFPRTVKCFCESGKKFKNCHLPLLTRTVTKEQAVKLQVQIKAALAFPKAR